MSNTSSDLLLSLSEFDSSCNRSKQNEVEVTSKCNVLKRNPFENNKVKSQSLSEDRSENYARLLKESEQALANRNVLVTLLQDQLVEMEELYKSTLEKQTCSNKTYSLYTKSTEEVQEIKLRKNKDDEGKSTTEDESPAKMLSQNMAEESQTSNADLSTNVADSSDLSLVVSMRSHHTIELMWSKIETEFFHEYQVNFEGPNKADSRHHLARTLENSPSRRQLEEIEDFFEQASKDEVALKRALHSQRDMIEDLRRNITTTTEELIELGGPYKNLYKGEQLKGALTQKFTPDFSSFEEPGLCKSPRQKRIIAESELGMLNEQLFQKEQVINVQEKKIRRLKYKLKCTYQELMRHVIKNEKQNTCEGTLDAVKGDCKDVLCLEEAPKEPELKIEELALNHTEEFEKFINGESVQNLTIKEVKSQSSTIKRKQGLDTIQTKIIQMASELKIANKEIIKCVVQNRTLFEDYEVKLEHVQNQLRLAKEENGKLEDAIHQRDEHLKQHLGEAFEGALQEKDKRIGVLDQNLKQITKELDNTYKERSQFFQEVQRLFCEYDVKLAVVKDEGEKAEKKVLQLKMNEDALNLQLTMAQAEAEKLKRDYDALNLHKQTMEEELKNIIDCKEKELSERRTAQDERDCENRRLEEEVKSLRDTLSQQKEELENGTDLVNEIKKLEDEVEAKAKLLKQNECNFQIKSALLLRQLGEAERQREEYIEKNKVLFRTYEDEMRQLSDDREKMSEAISRLKKEKEAEQLRDEVGELRARVLCLEKDKESLQGQIFNYESQLEKQCEEYERKVMLVTKERGIETRLQNQEEINSLAAKISELEAKLEAAERVQQRAIKMSEASLTKKSSNCSIFVIKEESVQEAHEEFIAEKENFETKLREMEKALEYERKSKTEVENELFHFRENEKTVNENLRKILPEFLGQGDKLGDDNRLKKEATVDLQDKLSLLSKELERAKAEKCELIKKGKQIFYHYETSITKLKSDYERLFGKQGDLKGTNKEKEENSERKLLKEEVEQLKETQEAYCTKLTSCLKELGIYKDEVKNWMEDYDKVVKEKFDLETESKILVNNVLHKDKVIKEMQAELYDVQEKLEDATRENEEKEKIICDYEAVYNQLSGAYEVIQNKLGALKKSKDEMNQKIIAKDQVIRQFEKQVDLERIENSQLTEDILNLNAKLSALEEHIVKKEKEFYVQLDQTKSTLFDVTQNYKTLETKYGCLAGKRHDVEFFKTENLNLTLGIEERDERIGSLKDEIKELQKELSRVRTEMDLNDLHASLNLKELQSTCAGLERDLKLTKHKCQELIKADDDFKDLQRQIVTLREDNNLLKDKLAFKNEEILRLSEMLERMQKEKTELNLHMANTVCELEEEIQKIKSNNRMLREQIGDGPQQDKENEILKQQLKTANAQIANLEADIQRLWEILQELENKRVSLNSKNKKLQFDLSVMEEELHVNKALKTENTKLQEKLDKIEGELFAMKFQCAEVHEELETTKTELAETREELSSRKRDLENESRCYLVEKTQKESLLTSKTDGRSVSTKVNSEKTNFHSSDTIKLNEHISVLYNNTEFSESRGETESSVSNAILTRGNQVQEQLASIHQMEKEVEKIILAVQQQNKNLRDCHSVRVKTEKDTNTRLQKVGQRSDTLAIDFNTFQMEIEHHINLKTLSSHQNQWFR